MADVEVQLLLGPAQIDQQLFDAAWYLHGVASVDEARERYTLARQRQAFLVSAHIFDLALNQPGWTNTQRLSYGFAAAIGYRRGGRDPNATAILNRLRVDISIEAPITSHLETLSMQAGVAFLGFETRTLFRWLSTWRRQFAAISTDAELAELTTTTLGPTQMVVLGAEDLLHYFARGDVDRLERGRARLRSVATGQAGPGDLNSRWVAAHLLRFSTEAEGGSLWNPEILPPSVPPLVRQAFTVGTPPILCLWEPQRELINGAQSPFDAEVRRMVLSVPTSGGKTLVAQMLAVEHLARTDRSVCYVAPTRSLGREVRRAMASRVRVLEKEAGSDQPDFPTFLGSLLDLADSDAPADVDVVTPERLGHLLRHDASDVLDKFGMFIFDEAQLIKESGRGFVLESVIALLDYLTKDSDHQIVLISAAMGNAGAIAQWLSPDGQSLLHESDWRGPRRLHAAFTTAPLWEQTRIEGGAGKIWKYRHTTELTGTIRLRMADGRTSELPTQGDTGWRLVRKSKDGQRYPKQVMLDGSRSTKQYMIASDMIAALGHAGSVLVVATTRAQAQQLAIGLASITDVQPTLTALVDFVRQQLSDDHPLVGTLRHGVGFHHAGLPSEVLEALEESVRADELPYLTCTSTLTDGVNLPVRTVIIYDQSYPDQHEDSRLRGARLVNAIGRAGRAGKETEGWIVLVRASDPTDQDFDDLTPNADALAVVSSLTTEAVLESFARLEEALRESSDALFTSAGTASDFISFVWLALAIEETRGTDPEAVDIEAIVASTLAATQSATAHALCSQIAVEIHRRYLATDSDARRRWPRTGTSIGSARLIDDLARRVAEWVLHNATHGTLPDLRNAQDAIRSLPSVFAELLKLPEAPDWRFRVSARGGPIHVEPVDLLTGWVTGESLSGLANEQLSAADKAAWRIEQMVDAVTTQFEHYLSWTVGALVEMINDRLSDAGTELRVCPELGGYIRYGVNTPHSLLLMTSGIRSRRLAHTVSDDIDDDVEPSREELRTWLSRSGISEWRIRYAATRTEILDLLEFTRLRNRSFLKVLLESGTVKVGLPDSATAPSSEQRLSLVEAKGEPAPAPLALYADDELVATIASEDHADIRAILDTGLELALRVDEWAEPATLEISLALGENDSIG